MNVSANDLECLMRDRFVITDDMTPAIREICEAIVEFAGEAVAAEREACASKARAPIRSKMNSGNGGRPNPSP